MGFFSKLFGGDKEANSGALLSRRPEPVAAGTEKNEVYAAVSGRVEKNENVPDPVFATGLLGESFAVWPVEGKVYAPVSGVVMSAMPHAFCIMTANEVEVLVHVGIDTVEMNGNGFDVWVQRGDEVRAGEAVVSFDLNKVRAAKHPEIVIVIVNDSEHMESVKRVDAETVRAGEKIIEFVK